MSIKFNVVKRGNPARPEAPRKFYPSIQSSGRTSVRQLAKKAADRSTLTTADMVAALESLLELIPEELAEGRVVELGDFGNFWLRSTAEGIADEKKVRGKQVKSLIPRFMPGKRFKSVLRTATFERKRR